VKARMGHEDLTLILDSGATHIVLFRTPQAMAKSRPVESTMQTLEGARQTVPTCWTAAMSFNGSMTVGTLPAAIVARPGTAVDGLLPTSLFKSVYVDQSHHEVALTR
jgi:hypothetical protein